MGAAELASLADYIDGKLSSEYADRQTVCEDVAARLREMARAVRDPRHGDPGRGAADTVLSALDDAANYRSIREGMATCASCEAAYGGLCLDHAADLDRADSYVITARELRMEAGR